jgi:hypothetical protein
MVNELETPTMASPTLLRSTRSGAVETPPLLTTEVGL